MVSKVQQIEIESPYDNTTKIVIDENNVIAVDGREWGYYEPYLGRIYARGKECPYESATWVTGYVTGLRTVAMGVAEILAMSERREWSPS